MKIKLLLATIIGLVAGSLLAAGVTNAPNVAFLWTYGTNPAGTAFRVYGTTNISLPVTNWPVLSTWTNWGTNVIGSTIYYSNALYFAPAQAFFAMTASNGFWGESPNSAVVSVPAPAQTPQSLSLQYIGQ